MNTEPTFPSVAALQSFTPTPNAAPLTVHAAVIEWAYPYEDTDPNLILARSIADRDERIKKAIRDEYDDRALSGFDVAEQLEIIRAGEATETYVGWMEAVLWPLQDHEGGPTVSTYEQEV